MTPTSRPQTEAARAYARMAGLACVTAAILALVGYYPTVAQAGQAGGTAMIVGLLVALAGSWLGSLPPFFFIQRRIEQFPVGILASLFVRFAGTLAIALVVRGTALIPAAPMLIWVGIGQTVMLAVDTLGLLRLSRNVARAHT